MRSLFTLIAALMVFAGQSRAAPAPEPVEIPAGESRLKGVLFRPEGAGPFPAVVALHGCGGLYNSGASIRTVYRDWGQRLAAQGFAVVYPDSHGMRGLGNQCGVRARAARLTRDRVADANAARLWLAGQAWVVRERISLLGWSSGGISALWTVRPKTGSAELNDFRSAIAFYPGCGRLNATAWSSRVPTLILIGSADEVSSAAVCQQMVAGARGRSARALVHVYAGAHQDFDHPNRPLQVRNGYAFSVDGSGRIHSGTNAAARADALKRVPEWFSR
jgi:dienelactone hydrolase